VLISKGDSLNQGKGASEKIFDREDLLNTVDGDTDLLGELIGMFLSTVPEQMENIRSALGRADYPDAAREAHKLKGTSANLRALSLRAAFADLEQAVKRQDSGEVTQLLVACSDEFERFREACETGSQS
jgi:histidine phosphotransfer protein HptB